MKKFIITASLFFALSALAGSKIINKSLDWTVEIDGEFLTLSTKNKDGNYLGRICSADDLNCYYFITQPEKCERELETVVLVNSSGGAHSVPLTCTGQINLNGRAHYGLIFSDYEDAKKILFSSRGIIGIAMATASGAFSVQRYSMNGFSNAFEVMAKEEEKILKNSRKQQKNDTRGTYL